VESRTGGRPFAAARVCGAGRGAYNRAVKMQYCTACQKALATIVIMDLDSGSVTGQQHLCASCAEQLGVVAPKIQIKHSTEILEDLLGGLKGKSLRELRGKRDVVCPGCGTSPQDFKVKGRFGCPRCYETFRAELLPLLQRVHESSSHRGRMPVANTGSAAAAAAPAKDPLADVRRRLEEAVRGERYEEAARLRDELRIAERGITSGGGTPSERAAAAGDGPPAPPGEGKP
jgi:protein arginine kinase activator